MNNMKTSRLARELSLPQQTLQRIVSGVSPNPHSKTLQPIADFFNISVEQLKGDDPLPGSAMGLEIPVNLKAKEIPVIEWDQLEAYLKVTGVYKAQNQIYVDSAFPEQAFALTLMDSSMEPYFPKESLLIFDPNKHPTDRCFALVKAAESQVIIFRQLLIDGENRYLKPLNPDLNAFSMRLLRENDYILGVMIEFRYRYNDL